MHRNINKKFSVLIEYEQSILVQWCFSDRYISAQIVHHCPYPARYLTGKMEICLCCFLSFNAILGGPDIRLTRSWPCCSGPILTQWSNARKIDGGAGSHTLISMIFTMKMEGFLEHHITSFPQSPTSGPGWQHYLRHLSLRFLVLSKFYIG